MVVDLWNIGFLAAALLATFFTVLTIKKLYRTGIEHYASKILILLGIVNTCLCMMLILMQGLRQIYIIASTGKFSFVGTVFIIFCFFIPLRIIREFCSRPGKLIKQFNLMPHDDNVINETVISLSRMMGINPPQIMSSLSVGLPFVFGSSSKKAVLAVPQNMEHSTPEKQKAVILHELAHIRNSDVGFLAWSNACIKDIKWMMIIIPLLLVLDAAVNNSQNLSPLAIYAVSLILLYIMLRYIVRKREMFADLTAAMLINSQKMQLSLSEFGTSPVSKMASSKPSRINNMYNWLTDKAMFAQKPWIWKFLLSIFNFFYTLHPTAAIRGRNISDIKKLLEKTQLPAIGESFYAGITFGLLGVIIGLGGYWVSVMMQYTPDTPEILRLSFEMYRIAAIPAFALWVFFLTLPYWASFSSPHLDGGFLLSQFKRQGIALLGACMVCPLILAGGSMNIDLQILSVVCLIWYICLVIFGFAISLISVFICMTIRYLQSSQSSDINKFLLAFIPFSTVLLVSACYGVFLMSRNHIFIGMNIILSLFAGAFLFTLLTGWTRFDAKDKYFIAYFGGFTVSIEGNKIRWLWVYEMVGCPILLIALSSLVYLAINFTFGTFLKNIDFISAMLFLIFGICVLLIVYRIRDHKKINGSKRTKLYRLLHSLDIFSTLPDAKHLSKIKSIASLYNFEKNSSLRRNHKNTMDDAYKCIYFLKKSSPDKDALGHPLEWVLKCQLTEGFGLWPESSPRLVSTYQALSILSQNTMPDKTEQHISWIKTLQQPDGSFKGPQSNRHPWEDTFFAIKSLLILGRSLERENSELCNTWARITLQKGIDEDRADIVYHCTGILDCLNVLDDETINTISNWLKDKIGKLLLTNVALNYETVHFAVMTYDIIRSRSECLSNEITSLLYDRIHTALTAELGNIRI